MKHSAKTQIRLCRCPGQFVGFVVLWLKCYAVKALLKLKKTKLKTKKN